jgi:Uma2 family endonuclease
VEPATWQHQHIVSELVALIRKWTRAGPDRGGVTLDPPVRIRINRGYLPDVAWYRAGRDRPRQGQPYLEGAPDLAIEVLSPSTRAIDVVRKRADYAQVGVLELWLIDPDGPAALVLRAVDGPEFVLAEELDADATLHSPLLPGLAIRVGDLLGRGPAGRGDQSS